MAQDHVAFMKMAIEEATDAVNSGDGGPYGAVVVKNGKIIAKGHNSHFKLFDPTAHGETVAIRNACRELGSFDLEGCDLYSSCYPCPMCFAAAHWARIRKVYYATSKAESREVGFVFDKSYQLLQISDKGAEYLERVEVEERFIPFHAWQAIKDNVAMDFSNF